LPAYRPPFDFLARGAPSGVSHLTQAWRGGVRRSLAAFSTARMCALPPPAVGGGCPSSGSPVASLATTGFGESGSCLESAARTRVLCAISAVSLGCPARVRGLRAEPRPSARPAIRGVRSLPSSLP